MYILMKCWHCLIIGFLFIFVGHLVYSIKHFTATVVAIWCYINKIEMKCLHHCSLISTSSSPEVRALAHENVHKHAYLVLILSATCDPCVSGQRQRVSQTAAGCKLTLCQLIAGLSVLKKNFSSDKPLDSILMFIHQVSESNNVSSTLSDSGSCFFAVSQHLRFGLTDLKEQKQGAQRGFFCPAVTIHPTRCLLFEPMQIRMCTNCCDHVLPPWGWTFSIVSEFRRCWWVNEAISHLCIYTFCLEFHNGV